MGEIETFVDFTIWVVQYQLNRWHAVLAGTTHKGLQNGVKIVKIG
jgi:hypothetical protein